MALAELGVVEKREGGRDRYMERGRKGRREGRYVARNARTLVNCVGEEQLVGEKHSEKEHSVVANLAWLSVGG